MTNKQTDKQSEFADCLISKQAALDAIVKCTICDSAEELAEYVIQQNYWNGWAGGVLEALSAVANVPSVEPERKYGRWIRVAGMNERCSVCDHYFPLSYFHGRPFEINYCPHCGADMRAERRTDG